MGVRGLPKLHSLTGQQSIAIARNVHAGDLRQGQFRYDLWIVFITGENRAPNTQALQDTKSYFFTVHGSTTTAEMRVTPLSSTWIFVTLPAAIGACISLNAPEL